MICETPSDIKAVNTEDTEGAEDAEDAEDAEGAEDAEVTLLKTAGNTKGTAPRAKLCLCLPSRSQKLEIRCSVPAACVGGGECRLRLLRGMNQPEEKHSRGVRNADAQNQYEQECKQNNDCCDDRVQAQPAFSPDARLGAASCLLDMNRPMCLVSLFCTPDATRRITYLLDPAQGHVASATLPRFDLPAY